ncbi:hypothetical protein P7A74_16445 [Clostridium perfringens]|nr:hypothetical protein [Clostridium perfringens]
MAKLKSKKKKKTEKTKIEDIKGSYKFKYLKFNFSFLSNNKYGLKKMDKQMKADLIDRMEELSSISYMELSALPKERGFEDIKSESISIEAEFKEKQFNDGNFRNKSDKFKIIRLYPNNNPKPVRLIGKEANNIFYLLYIDQEHKCYK